MRSIPSPSLWHTLVAALAIVGLLGVPAASDAQAPPVSFSRQVAPILVRSCGGCHVTGRKGDFQMPSHDALMRSGMVQRGVGRSSRLVEVILTGDMPRGGGKISQADVNTLIAWIDAGATFDGDDPTVRLDALARGGTAAMPSTEAPVSTMPPMPDLPEAELSELRAVAGLALWRRAIPDEEPVVERRDGVCVIGNLPAQRLGELADTAADVAADVRKQLVADGPLIKGGIVLYAVRQAYDYSAIWQNVDRAERPRGITCHAGVSNEVVYAALFVPSSEPGPDLRASLAESITAAALAGRGAPAWLARGAGRAVATRLEPKAAIVQQWRREMQNAARGMQADALAGKGTAVDQATLAGGFVTAIAGGAKLRQFVAALDAGKACDAAFAGVFRSSPDKAYALWAGRVAK